MNDSTKSTEKDKMCIFCGEDSVIHQESPMSFPYYHKGTTITLQALVPIISCSKCKEEWTGYEAEIIRHETVCRFLGRLTPAEIVELRKHNGLSQSGLGLLLSIDYELIIKWERGASIQSEEFNSRLRKINRNKNA